jgi:hypothetical protein
MDTSARDDRIFRIIDNVLKQVFGENTALFINEYLEQRYSLQQRDFSKKIVVFAKGLEDALSSCAFAIETEILVNIYPIYGSFNSINCESKSEGDDFANQMKIAKQKA